MIVGLGIDICPVARIGDILARHGDVFAARVFTEDERAHAGGGPVRDERLAARWAAKEAAIKALGAPDGLRWHEMEVVNAEDGAPALRLSGRAAQRARELRMDRVRISLTHAGGVAAAVVIIEGRGEP